MKEEEREKRSDLVKRWCVYP